MEYKKFIEEEYLRANPDVFMAVRNGEFPSGLDHFQKFGKAEGRAGVPRMQENLSRIFKQKRLTSDRNEKILFSIEKSIPGLEIGPSHRPVAPKRKGFNVKILDHLSAEGLREKYRGHGVEIGAIEDVDYVWSGEPISELVGNQRFGWIIASHLIEHTPDLLGFLNECEKILADNGVLSLVIPDKRYCFDHFRELSSLARIIDAHIVNTSSHTPGTAADYFLNVTKKGGDIAWKDGHRGKYEFVHSLQDAMAAMQHAKLGEYIDLHAWCFVPSSFRLLIEDLYALGLIQFRELIFFDTVGHEFFISLGKNAPGPDIPRMEMVQKKQRELMRSM